MECQFCKNKFTTLKILTTHQKSAKYCIKLQGVKGKYFNCDFCIKKFTQKVDLQRHYTICINKKLKDQENNYINRINQEINKKDKEIIEKDKKIIEKDKQIIEKKLKPYIYNDLILNNINIIFRPIDGYINLTQLCKAGGKEFKHWKENKNCEAFLQALSSSVGIPTDDLIKYESGSNENRATWGHRLVAIEIARWISPEFGVKIIKWTDEILITGKVELGNEKSNKELENIYQEKINNLQNKLNNYETTIFNRKIDYCPIEYYGKDIVYFLKFNIPIHLYSEYTSKYTKLDNKDYSCVEFGVTSNIEERLKSHKRDKKKENLIFLHAIELKKRYTASKMEFYIKTIAQQLNIKFEYEKKKECVLVNEEMFNILVNKIKTGLINLEYDYEENELEEDKEMVKCNYNVEIKKLDNEIEIKKLDNEKEIELKKIEMITELIKNKLITLDEFKNMLGF